MKIFLLACSLFIYTIVFSQPLEGYRLKCNSLIDKDFLLDDVNEKYNSRFTVIQDHNDGVRTFYIGDIPYTINISLKAYKVDHGEGNEQKLEGLLYPALNKKTNQYNFTECKDRGNFAELTFKKVENGSTIDPQTFVNGNQSEYVILIFNDNTGAWINSENPESDQTEKTIIKVEKELNLKSDFKYINITDVAFMNNFYPLIDDLKLLKDSFSSIVVNPIGLSGYPFRVLTFNESLFVYSFIASRYKEGNRIDVLGETNLSKHGNRANYFRYSSESLDPNRLDYSQVLHQDAITTNISFKLHRNEDFPKQGLSMYDEIKDDLLDLFYFNETAAMLKQIAASGDFFESRISKHFNLVLVVVEYSISAHKFIYQPILLNEKYHPLDLSILNSNSKIIFNDTGNLLHLTNKTALAFGCLYNNDSHSGCTLLGLIEVKKKDRSRLSPTAFVIQTNNGTITPFIERIISSVPSLEAYSKDSYAIFRPTTCEDLNAVKRYVKNETEKGIIWMVSVKKKHLMRDNNDPIIIDNIYQADQGGIIDLMRYNNDPIIIEYNLNDNTAQRVRFLHPEVSTKVTYSACINNNDIYFQDVAHGHTRPQRILVPLDDFYLIWNFRYNILPNNIVSTVPENTPVSSSLINLDA